MILNMTNSFIPIWMGLGGGMVNGLLPAALLLVGPPAPPMPPIEIKMPVSDEQPGYKLENFRFEIDQKSFDCSAGTMNSGNKAPYAYNPSTNAFAGELQIHAAQCKTRF